MGRNYTAEFNHCMAKVKSLPAREITTDVRVNEYITVDVDVDFAASPEIAEQVIGEFFAVLPEPKTGEDALALFEQIRDRFGGSR